MKHIPLQAGPFKKGPFFEPDEIEKMAVADLKQTGLLPQEPRAIDVDALARKLFSFDLTYAETGDGILGYISFGPRGPEKITINSDLADLTTGLTTEHRRKSTATHEVGHGRLHAGPFIELALAREHGIFGEFVRNASLQPLRACRSQDIRDGELAKVPRLQGWEAMAEWQANRYMAAALAPARLLQRAVTGLRHGAGVHSGLDAEEREDLVPAVSEIFNISKKLARNRMAELFPPAGAQREMFA